MGRGQWPPFVSLEMAEAGWNPRAVNPSSGAAGLAQALPPSKYPPGAWPYQGPESARLQLQWMTGYIRDRYGDPASAWAFHQSHNWYKEGGVLMLGDSLGVGMKQAAGFPGGWTDYVADSKTSGWGLQQLGKLSDQGAVVFEFGTNDANNGDVSGFKSNLGKAIKSAHGKNAGLAAMTVAGVSNASGVNRAIGSSGVDAVADWAGVASRYNADPHTDASGYRAMQKLVKAAAGKAKGKGGRRRRRQRCRTGRSQQRARSAREPVGAGSRQRRDQLRPHREPVGAGVHRQLRAAEDQGNDRGVPGRAQPAHAEDCDG